MSIWKLAVVTAVAAMILAACTSASPGASTGASTGASVGTGCLVGVSWNGANQERFMAEESAMKAAVAKAGGTYTRTDAENSSEQQMADIDNLLGQGVGAIILASGDTAMTQTAIDRAAAAGVPVIAQDILVEDQRIFYLTFDNKLVGTMIAQAVEALAPEGNYAIILGDATDANVKFLRDGMSEAGIPKLGDVSGKIHVVYEQDTPDWSPDGARDSVKAALNSTTPINNLQAVLAENDGLAGGAITALKAAGLSIPVGGQDGDAAALNRVALGTQTVSVWKNAFALGDTAGSAAMQLCHGTKLSDLVVPDDLPAGAKPPQTTAVEFTTPGGKTVWSISLTPQPLTKANVHDAIDAGWVTQAEVCTGVPAGTVAGCP